MLNKITIALFAFLLLSLVGCRTGEFKFDPVIYKKMPDILKNEPTLTGKLATNPDGSIKVTFAKGTMFLYYADGLDENTRMVVGTKAFELFHNEYMADPAVKMPNGTYRRDKIFFHGFVGETELYIIEWTLGQPNPNILNNRSGNFM